MNIPIPQNGSNQEKGGLIDEVNDISALNNIQGPAEKNIQQIPYTHRLTKLREYIVDGEVHVIAGKTPGYIGDEDAIHELQSEGVLMQEIDPLFKSEIGKLKHYYSSDRSLVPYKFFLNVTKVDALSDEKRRKINSKVKSTFRNLRSAGYVIGKQGGGDFTYKDLAFDEETLRVVILPGEVYVTKINNEQDLDIDQINSKFLNDVQNVKGEHLTNQEKAFFTQRIGNQIVGSILKSMDQGDRTPYLDDWVDHDN